MTPDLFAARGRTALYIAVLLTFIVAETAVAGVSAYLPLNLSPALESRVERALVLAGVPTMTRPIRVAAVSAALPAVCRKDRPLCRQLRIDLAPYLKSTALTGAGVEGATAGRSKVTQPEQHGEPMNASWGAYASGYARFGEHVLLGGGAVAYPGRFTPTGTMVSLGGERAQLDLGYRDHWWSPFRLGSMLIGTEAPTMPSATLTNVEPLTRAHLRYELFLARMSYSNRIGYNGSYIAGYPQLFGFHLDVEPAPGWSLSVSRLMQFGGGARPHSLNLLLKTFLNSRKYNNTSPTLTSDQEFGNEQVAFSSSLVLPVRMPMAVYIEYAAEDNFHAGPFRFGSSAVSAGFYLPQLRPNVQLRYEFSEWQTNWYVHHIYQDGVRNYGAALGNWAGDWRRPQDGVGAQAHAVELTWDRADGRQLDLQYRTALNASYTGGHYQRSHDVDLRLSWPWRSLQVGARIEGGRDEFGASFGRLATFAQFTGQHWARPDRTPADDGIDRSDIDGGSTSSATKTASARRKVTGFIDMGMFVSKQKLDYNAGQDIPIKSNAGSFHLGLGVRRAFNRNTDLGTRIEFDNVKGRLFTALRAVDYRHHFGSMLAGSLFFGVGRYDGPTPAYGWYGGGGLQWMNVFKNLDIGVDVRTGDHLVRNKNLPSDTIAPRGYDNAFYNILGESIYLSRHF